MFSISKEWICRRPTVCCSNVRALPTFAGCEVWHGSARDIGIRLLMRNGEIKMMDSFLPG